jgi:hypothetical protein
MNVYHWVSASHTTVHSKNVLARSETIFNLYVVRSRSSTQIIVTTNDMNNMNNMNNNNNGDVAVVAT